MISQCWKFITFWAGIQDIFRNSKKYIFFSGFFFSFDKILLDRSALNSVCFDKIPALLMESRCFLQSLLPGSHSRIPGFHQVILTDVSNHPYIEFCAAGWYCRITSVPEQDHRFLSSHCKMCLSSADALGGGVERKAEDCDLVKFVQYI